MKKRHYVEQNFTFIKRNLNFNYTRIILSSILLTATIIIPALFTTSQNFWWSISISSNIALIVLIGFTTWEAYILRDMVFATEFQNSIFAEALCADNDFCLIVKADSTVFYVDERFKNFFGPYLKEGVNELEALYTFFNEEVRNKIDIALRNYHFTEVTPASLEKDKKWNLKVVPLEINMQSSNQTRMKTYGMMPPKGYFVIKGTFKPQVEAPLDIVLEKYFSIIENFTVPTLILSEAGKILKYNFAFTNAWQNFKFEDAYFSDLIDEEQANLYKKFPLDNNFIIRRNIKFVNRKHYAVYIILLCFSDKERYALTFFNNIKNDNIGLESVHSQKIQAVGQLAGGIAHDFNNLLTAIIGFCDLLLMKHKPLDPNFPEIMQIKQNAIRAANLIKQLLAFSRKQVMTPQILDITQILDDISSLIGRLIGENIDLQISHEVPGLTVKADKVQLEQVIINLAVNARDAMPKGGFLKISTQLIELKADGALIQSLICPEEELEIEVGTYVLIKVEDSGGGIAKEHIKKIFDPFYSTKPINQGTGLGLSMVLGIIRQTGGYMFFDTKLNEGTYFYIFLKYYPETPEDNLATAEEESILNETDNEVDTEGIQILLVEDEESVREFTKHALNYKGYNVIQASCAEEGLEIIKAQGDTIDIIITDVIMKAMTGPEMIEKVKITHPHIKVIFISGYAEEALDKANKGEKINFLSKPFSIKELISKLQEISSEKTSS